MYRVYFSSLILSFPIVSLSFPFSEYFFPFQPYPSSLPIIYIISPSLSLIYLTFTLFINISVHFTLISASMSLFIFLTFFDKPY